MSIRSSIEQWLFDPRSIRESDGKYEVVTNCLYPSMSSVVVTVEGGKTHFMVHDSGLAVAEAAASGVRLEKFVSLVRPMLKNYGLLISEGGQIRSPQISAGEIGAGIAVVANASRDAANILISRRRNVATRDVKAIVSAILHKRFAEDRIHNNFYVIGASSKHHRFDYVVDAENGAQLLFDVVLPDASSINSAIVAHLDVSKRQIDRNIVPRLVYDDSREWKSQDLSLLSVTDHPIRLSYLESAIERLAA